jgi:multidrug efflux pump
VALGDYAARNVLPELQRVPGVGQAQLFGTERAMRIWLDPAKLLGFGLSTAEVNAAIRAQNAQVSAGTIGDLPNVPGPDAVRHRGRRRPAGQRAAVRQDRAARQCRRLHVRLRDVARIELGAQTYATSARLNGKPSTGIGVQLSPTGNALETAAAVRASAWTSCSATSRRA